MPVEDPLHKPLLALRILIAETQRSVLAFALYDDVAIRERMIRDLREQLTMPVRVAVLSKERKNPFTVLGKLGESERACVCFVNVEEAFPEFFGYANLQREALLETSHATVFWVRVAGMQQIAKQAPDFWSWRSGVFDFRASEQTIPAEPPGMPVDSEVATEEVHEYETLIQQFLEHSEPNESQIAELEIRLARSLRHIGASERARDTALKALERAERIGNSHAEASALKVLGEIEAYDMKDEEAARRYLERALAIYERTNSIEDLGQCLLGLSLTYYPPDGAAAAELYASRSIPLLERAENYALLSMALRVVGVLAMWRGDFDIARERLTRALSLAERVGNRYLIAGLHGHFGELEKRAGNLGSALEHFEKSVQEYQASGEDFSALGSIWSQIGEILESRHDWTRAKEAYTKALSIYKLWRKKELAADTERALTAIDETQKTAEGEHAV